VIGDILQPSHLLFILVIALLVLGPKRLPEVARSLGKGLRDFRGALSGADPREELADVSQHAVQPVAVPQPEPVPVSAPTEAPSESPPAAEPVAHEPAEHSG
jgi:sec-independent protein translocase protein TatA